MQEFYFSNPRWRFSILCEPGPLVSKKRRTWLASLFLCSTCSVLSRPLSAWVNFLCGLQCLHFLNSPFPSRPLSLRGRQAEAHIWLIQRSCSTGSFAYVLIEAETTIQLHQEAFGILKQVCKTGHEQGLFRFFLCFTKSNQIQIWEYNRFFSKCDNPFPNSL